MVCSNERHGAMVTDVLRFVGLIHGGIETLLAFRTDYADLLQGEHLFRHEHKSTTLQTIAALTF